MKALLFHNFKNICIKTTFWTRNTNCFTILYIRTFEKNAIQTVSIIQSQGRVNEGPPFSVLLTMRLIPGPLTLQVTYFCQYDCCLIDKAWFRILNMYACWYREFQNNINEVKKNRKRRGQIKCYLLRFANMIFFKSSELSERA